MDVLFALEHHSHGRAMIFWYRFAPGPWMYFMFGAIGLMHQIEIAPRNGRLLLVLRSMEMLYLVLEHLDEDDLYCCAIYYLHGDLLIFVRDFVTAVQPDWEPIYLD